jgi:hypothetical protein
MGEQKRRQSPYQKFGKAPYPYSGHLRAWERAKKAGNDRAAEEAAREHEKQFGYRRNGRV